MQKSLLDPFGVLVQSSPDSDALTDIPSTQIEQLLAEHFLVLFRGFAPLEDEEYVKFARQFGSLLEWEFGPILELKIHEQPPNHIFTSGRVELHWDGAFVNDKPHYNVFQCLEGTNEDAGGETLFVNTDEVLNMAVNGDVKGWHDIVIEYSTEKKAHYGGTIREPLISVNPYNGKPVIRFIEAFNPDYEEINPMFVRVDGLSESQSDSFLRKFNDGLYRREVMYQHQWKTGDFLIADNSMLLHGRNRFRMPGSKRHIKRINIL